MLVTSGQKGAFRVDWNQVFEVLCLLFFVGQGRNLIGEIDVPKMTGMFTGWSGGCKPVCMVQIGLFDFLGCVTGRRRLVAQEMVPNRWKWQSFYHVSTVHGSQPWPEVVVAAVPCMFWLVCFTTLWASSNSPACPLKQLRVRRMAWNPKIHLGTSHDDCAQVFPHPPSLRLRWFVLGHSFDGNCLGVGELLVEVSWRGCYPWMEGGKTKKKHLVFHPKVANKKWWNRHTLVWASMESAWFQHFWVGWNAMIKPGECQ